MILVNERAAETWWHSCRWLADGDLLQIWSILRIHVVWEWTVCWVFVLWSSFESRETGTQHYGPGGMNPLQKGFGNITQRKLLAYGREHCVKLLVDLKCVSCVPRVTGYFVCVTFSSHVTVIYAVRFLFYMNNSVIYTVIDCEKNRFIIKNMFSTIQKRHIRIHII